MDHGNGLPSASLLLSCPSSLYSPHSRVPPTFAKSSHIREHLRRSLGWPCISWGIRALVPVGSFHVLPAVALSPGSPLPNHAALLAVLQAPAFLLHLALAKHTLTLEICICSSLCFKSFAQTSLWPAPSFPSGLYSNAVPIRVSLPAQYTTAHTYHLTRAPRLCHLYPAFLWFTVLNSI